MIAVDPADNVLVALMDLAPGETVEYAQTVVVIVDEILAGHKVALRQIGCGEPVLKYGEVIGLATCSIPRGCHVHVHNVASARLPGPQAG